MGNFIKSAESQKEAIREEIKREIVGLSLRRARTYLEDRKMGFWIEKADQCVIVRGSIPGPDHAHLIVETPYRLPKQWLDGQDFVVRHIEGESDNMPDKVIVRGVYFGR